MKINVYEKKQIIKTYEAETYDLMFGTIEDIAEAVNLDALKTGSDVEIIKLVGNLVMNSMSTVKELLKDIFDGITDEELKKVKKEFELPGMEYVLSFVRIVGFPIYRMFVKLLNR